MDKSRIPFKMEFFEVAPGSETHVDQHKVEEVWMIKTGTGELIYDGKTMPVAEEEIFYFESMKTHQVKNTGNKTLRILSIYW